jgi:hypothetical protein
VFRFLGRVVWKSLFSWALFKGVNKEFIVFNKKKPRELVVSFLSGTKYDDS